MIQVTFRLSLPTEKSHTPQVLVTPGKRNVYPLFVNLHGALFLKLIVAHDTRFLNLVWTRKVFFQPTNPDFRRPVAFQLVLGEKSLKLQFLHKSLLICSVRCTAWRYFDMRCECCALICALPLSIHALQRLPFTNQLIVIALASIKLQASWCSLRIRCMCTSSPGKVQTNCHRFQKNSINVNRQLGRTLMYIPC